MIVIIDSTNPASVVCAESPDGVNEPCAVTLVVQDYGGGRLGVRLIGGDPERSSEHQAHPTLLDGMYHADGRYEPDEGGDIRPSDARVALVSALTDLLHVHGGDGAPLGETLHEAVKAANHNYVREAADGGRTIIEEDE